MSIVTGAKTVYPTKRDAWLVALLWVTVIVMLISAGAIWKEPEMLAGEANGNINTMLSVKEIWERGILHA